MMQTFWRKALVFLTPRHRLLKARLRGGAVVLGKNQPGFGGRAVYIYRDAIEPELEHLDRFLPKKGVFIDVGANTGIYTIKAATHFADQGVVIAIEPVPDVLATLYQTVRANGLSNVRLRNLCASDRIGERTLWMNAGRPQSFSLIHRWDEAPGFSTLAVPLDVLFQWEGLDRLDYIKIDAEGAEQDILAGAAQIIRRYRPIIQTEVSVDDFCAELPNYSAFRALGSPNNFYMPFGHPSENLPKQLGWQALSQPPAPVVERPSTVPRVAGGA